MTNRPAPTVAIARSATAGQTSPGPSAAITDPDTPAGAERGDVRPAHRGAHNEQ